MTHDELLTKITHRMLDEVQTKSHDYKTHKALLAVVELHKPEHSIRGYRCTFDDELYPCPTIQAIEAELN